MDVVLAPFRIAWMFMKFGFGFMLFALTIGVVVSALGWLFVAANIVPAPGNVLVATTAKHR